MGNSGTKKNDVSKTNVSTIDRSSPPRFVYQVTTPNSVQRTETINALQSAAIIRNPGVATGLNTFTSQNAYAPYAPVADLNRHATPQNFGNSTPYNPHYNVESQIPLNHIQPPNHGLYPVLPHNFTATSAAKSSENWQVECIKMKQLPQIQTEHEFSLKWLSWRNEFLNMMKKTDAKREHKNQWGDMLLNLIGPIGKIIFESLSFNNTNEKKNIDILLKKFDTYFIFDTRKRHPREDIYKYIKDLQSRTELKKIKDGDAAVRKKIVDEIEKKQFTETACTLIPSFTFSSNLEKLTLKEIAFIWELTEHDSLKKEKEKYHFIVNCKECGSDHAVNDCKALGKQCPHCKESNHFGRRCPTRFKRDCGYCGGSHQKNRCPSYGEICSKCKEKNHFSWKCRVTQILNCSFCGMTHKASRSECPAKDSICSICGITGHFPAKCRRNLHRR